MARFWTVLLLVFAILTIALGNLFVFYPENFEFGLKEKEIPVNVYEYSKYEPSYVRKSNDMGISKPIYVMPYVGDIDGEVSEDWYYFFDILTTFHEEEEIPVAFSFYPTSINTQSSYMDVFLKMYEGNYIELMQKEYIEENLESEIESLPSNLKIQMRKGILDSEKAHFEKIMKQEGYKDIEFPISYTQLGGRITEDDRKALELAGIKVYFDVYYDEKIGPIKSTENFDVMQYGVGFTQDGSAGSLTQFRSADELISQLNEYERLDLEMSSLNGKAVIPLWTHQQDFERLAGSSEVDMNKWEIYTETLLRLRSDPNVEFITPKKMYYSKRRK
jgi:hypothetical protein